MPLALVPLIPPRQREPLHHPIDLLIQPFHIIFGRINAHTQPIATIMPENMSWTFGHFKSCKTRQRQLFTRIGHKHKILQLHQRLPVGFIQNQLHIHLVIIRLKPRQSRTAQLICQRAADPLCRNTVLFRLCAVHANANLVFAKLQIALQTRHRWNLLQPPLHFPQHIF